MSIPAVEHLCLCHTVKALRVWTQPAKVSWYFLQVCRCEVDIAAVARTCSDWPLLLAFLQRRQPGAHPTCDIKALLLTIVKVKDNKTGLDFAFLS
jgi:hypothetical protein